MAKKKSTKAKVTAPEEERYILFQRTIESELGIKLIAEFRFHPVRKWKFDFLVEGTKVAIEVDGGTFRKGGGAHQGVSFVKDCEKLNNAVALGYKVLRFLPEQLMKTTTSDMIRAVVFDVPLRDRQTEQQQMAERFNVQRPKLPRPPRAELPMKKGI